MSESTPDFSPPAVRPSVKEAFDAEFARRAALPKSERDSLPDMQQVVQHTYGQLGHESALPMSYNDLRTMPETPQLRGEEWKFLTNEEIAKRVGMALVGALTIGPNLSESTPNPTPEDPERPQLQELQAVSPETRLSLAEHDYAKMSARERNSYWGRFCQGRSRLGKLVRKIPKVSSTIEQLNTLSNKKLQEAKASYEDAFNRVGIQAVEELRAEGVSEDEIRSLAAAGVIMRGTELEHKIVTERQMQSKKSNKFVNWWVNSTGFKGKLKKAGVIAGAGLAAGFIAGAALPVGAAWLTAGGVGALAGGATGGGIARHITRRRANTPQGANTLAKQQSGLDIQSHIQSVENTLQNGEFASVDTITESVEDRTNSEILGNRKRMKAAVAIGQMMGGFGGIIGSETRQFIDEFEMPNFDNNQAHAQEPRPRQEVAEAPQPNTEAPVQETINGRSFNVESGHGFTHEIQEFAQANGGSVDSRRAYDIYNEAVMRFGKDGLIEPTGTYQRAAGDFGINSPGMVSWKPGVAEFLKSRL